MIHSSIIHQRAFIHQQVFIKHLKTFQREIKIEIFFQCETVSMEMLEEAVTLQRKRDGENVIEDGSIYYLSDFRLRMMVSSKLVLA